MERKICGFPIRLAFFMKHRYLFRSKISPNPNFRRFYCNRFASSSKTKFHNFDGDSRSIKNFRPDISTNGNYDLATLERNVDDMLLDFRNGKPHYRTSVIRMATYLCKTTDRCDEFIDVVDEWFRQVRPLLDQQTFFKASSNLCNLGKLNRSSNGRVIDRLGWPPIEYFIQRMLEMGLHRFHAEDVASALAGLHDLIGVIDGFDEIPIWPSIERWLRAYERYLMEKQPTDLDWSVLIREAAPLSLLYLQGINADLIVSNHRRLIEFLFRLSKFGFDALLTEWPENVKEIYQSTVAIFGHACIQFDLNPDQILEGTFRSWFDCFLLLMTNRKFSFLDFGYSIQIAAKYSDFRSAQFWPNFDAWHSAMFETLRSFLIIDRESSGNSLNSYKKAINLLYNFGLFIKASSLDDEFQRRTFEFRTLFYLFDTFVSSIDRVESISISEVQRTRMLFGIREFKRALGLD